MTPALILCAVALAIIVLLGLLRLKGSPQRQGCHPCGLVLLIAVLYVVIGLAVFAAEQLTNAADGDPLRTLDRQAVGDVLLWPVRVIDWSRAV
jgi:hypothetical protein